MNIFSHDVEPMSSYEAAILRGPAQAVPFECDEASLIFPENSNPEAAAVDPR
jgi:hypothetical protein